MLQLCCLAVLLVLFNSPVTFGKVVKREEGCPVYEDPEWKRRESECVAGKHYHCFMDIDGDFHSDGCYEVKQCLKGAHPVVENGGIICSICESGFQQVEPLKSNEFTYSYCESHSRPCDYRYGVSECRAPSAEQDGGCSCNASLGYSVHPKDERCLCFTPNDHCACAFNGCPPGKIESNDTYKYCKPAPPMITQPTMPAPVASTGGASTKATDGTKTGHALAFETILGIICALMIFLFSGGACVVKHWTKIRGKCCTGDTSDQTLTATNCPATAVQSGNTAGITSDQTPATINGTATAVQSGNAAGITSDQTPTTINGTATAVHSRNAAGETPSNRTATTMNGTVTAVQNGNTSGHGEQTAETAADRQRPQIIVYKAGCVTVSNWTKKVHPDLPLSTDQADAPFQDGGSSAETDPQMDGGPAEDSPLMDDQDCHQTIPKLTASDHPAGSEDDTGVESVSSLVDTPL